MNSNPRDPIQLYQEFVHYWLLSEVQKIYESFFKISQCIDTSHLLNQTMQINTHTGKTQQMISQPYALTNDDSMNPQKENERDLQEEGNTERASPEQSNISPEVIQENRIKSNQKKKIATGRICTVKCNDETRIINGYMVVFKYYSIKLTFGPFAQLNVARVVRSDFRERLFLLKITKQNYNTVIPSFYLEFKYEMETKYKELPIYHKTTKKR